MGRGGRRLHESARRQDGREPEEIADLGEGTENGEAGEPRRAFVQSLERGLAVLRAFDLDNSSP